MEFTCVAQQVEGRVVLTVAGDVDMAIHERFRQEAEQWVSDSADVVLECSGVTFMDSMGLRVLVGLQQAAAGHGRQFLLQTPSQAVVRLLEIAGVSEFFPVID